MCSKQKGRFKSKRLQYDYKNKWVENINKVYHENENVNLMIENVIQVKSAITINVDVSVKLRKTSGVQKRLYLESHYM